jgi:hypothetical protein
LVPEFALATPVIDSCADENIFHRVCPSGNHYRSAAYLSSFQPSIDFVDTVERD